MPGKRRDRQHRNAATASDSQSRPSTSTSGPSIWGDSARRTSTHVFFWSGRLSNWHLGPRYTGSRAFALLLPELVSLNAAHPPTNTFVTRLIQDHHFNCGEQWMMAMKAWFFETDLDLGNRVVSINIHGDNDNDEPADVARLTDHQFQALKSAMYATTPATEWPETSPERQMWESSICQILRAKKPRDQKALGRTVEGFDETVWTDVNMACVVAACIARAEVDPMLSEMYRVGVDEGLAFVEGSPTDTIWGVGLHWRSTTIEDPALWVGENRLGVCHDRAAVRVQEMIDEGKAGLKERVVG